MFKSRFAGGKWIRQSRLKDYLDIPKRTTAQLTSMGTTSGFGRLGNEAQIVYDETTNTLKFNDGTDWIQLESGAADTIDAAYNADTGERTITVDDGSVVFDLADNSNDYNLVINNTTAGTIAVGLQIDAEASSSVFDDGIKIITTAGAITDGIDVSDTGITNAINVGAQNITGTTATIGFSVFDVDASGNVTCNDLTVGGTHSIGTLAVTTAFTVGTTSTQIDATFNSGVAGDTMLWDASQKTLLFTDSHIHLQDNDNIDFGAGSATATGDWRIYSNGTHLYVAANADVATQTLYLGDDTNDIDVIWEGDTDTKIFQMDSSTNQIELNGADMRFQDSDILHFGDGATTKGDFKISSDGTDLFIQANANVADQALKIGDYTTNDVDVFIYGVTSGDYIQFDSSADKLTLTDIAFVQTETGTTTVSLDITNAATGVHCVEINSTGALTDGLAGLAVLSTGGLATGGACVLIDYTGTADANARMLELEAATDDLVAMYCDVDTATNDAFYFNTGGNTATSKTVLRVRNDGTPTDGTSSLLELDYTGATCSGFPTALIVNATGKDASGILVDSDVVIANGTNHLELYSGLDAADGVVFDTWHERGTPAAADRCFQLRCYGEDAGSGKTLYGQIEVESLLATAGQEDGEIIFSVAADNGALTQALVIGPQTDSANTGISVGSGAATAAITSEGAYTLLLQTNYGTTSATIQLESGTNSDVILTSQGTGEFVLTSAGGTAADLTTASTVDLIIDTNEGTNSGNITIYDGADGDITITTNGAGSCRIDEAAIRYQQRDIAAGTATDTSDNTDGLIQVATDGATDCTASLPAADAQLGLVLTYQHDVDGGKNVVVTCVGGDTIDEDADTGNTTHTMANAGEWIQLMAVGDNIWAVIARQGGTLA